VLIYFAHRDARTCAGADVQPEYADAVDAFLAAGGGVVVFHHGIYQWENKQAILQRLGGHADQYDWELAGQRVIAVAPAHFVAANALAYPDDVAFSDATHGIAAGTYPSFTNAPDERYPSFTLDPNGGAQTVLFASDYAAGGRVLGYALTRGEWSGKVVVYQPGEYQPNALDLHGPNFQILANAIVWSSNALR
jgi:trehalose utilization protein